VWARPGKSNDLRGERFVDEFRVPDNKEGERKKKKKKKKKFGQAREIAGTWGSQRLP
jgi:hypothetical protein